MAPVDIPAQVEAPPPPIPVAFGADEVTFDTRDRALVVTGHVHVDEPPFHLTSEQLQLRRVPIGVQLVGQGRLAFCPCLGTPLAVRFDGATVAPPHDVILRNPVLEVFGVPVAWAPAFWLRSPGRVGVLPPDVAWRGGDGLFLGEGVHLPWVDGDTQRGLDLRAGAYVEGGVAVDGDMRTATSDTHVKWDRLHSDDGIGVSAHGATASSSPQWASPAGSVAWDVDALRGRRAVVATTDVEAAARPYDRAEANAAWRDDGWTFASGARTAALRGGDLADLGVGGPLVTARRSGALGASVGAYDLGFEGGAVSGEGTGTTSFARAEGGTLLASRLGPVGATLALRGMGDIADDGFASGLDGAGQARATLSLPLSRGYETADPNDPLVHETEPRVEAAGIATHASDVLVVPAGRGMVVPEGAAWVADAGWRNAIGRWGTREAAELDASGGVVGDSLATLGALRARASASGRWVALRADFARTFSAGSGSGDGGAFVARMRVGPLTGLHLAVHAAERDGVDPLVARALVDAPLEPSSGFLTIPGWTGGARLGIPLGTRVTVRGGADVDLQARELVAALGALELHDPCNCVVVRANAAHRIGRDGIDVWVTVDIPR